MRRLLIVLFLLPLACQAQNRGPLDLQALYDGGMPFSTFLDEAERRHDTWHENYSRELSAELLQSAKQIPGSWRLLVVAEDWCGDSANTLPYVASLDDALDNLEVRVVRSREGRPVMEAYRTPDGRAATPTMVLLNDQGEESGCLVEQPQRLQTWWLGEAQEIEDEDARYDQKYAWYDDDAGASTTAEIVDLMRSASEGQSVCRAPAGEGA